MGGVAPHSQARAGVVAAPSPSATLPPPPPLPLASPPPQAKRLRRARSLPTAQPGSTPRAAGGTPTVGAGGSGGEVALSEQETQALLKAADKLGSG